MVGTGWTSPRISTASSACPGMRALRPSSGRIVVWPRSTTPISTPSVARDDFQDLQAAYETLADAERRRRYDETLSQGERDKFQSLAWSFVRSPAAGDLRRPIRPGSLSGEILLTPKEAAAGGVLSLDVPISATCPSCEGTGGFVFDCGRCGGEGKIERRLPVPLRIPVRVARRHGVPGRGGRPRRPLDPPHRPHPQVLRAARARSASGSGTGRSRARTVLRPPHRRRQRHNCFRANGVLPSGVMARRLGGRRHGHSPAGPPLRRAVARPQPRVHAGGRRSPSLSASAPTPRCSAW